MLSKGGKNNTKNLCLVSRGGWLAIHHREKAAFRKWLQALLLIRKQPAPFLKVTIQFKRVVVWRRVYHDGLCEFYLWDKNLRTRRSIENESGWQSRSSHTNYQSSCTLHTGTRTKEVWWSWAELLASNLKLFSSQTQRQRRRPIYLEITVGRMTSNLAIMGSVFFAPLFSILLNSLSCWHNTHSEGQKKGSMRSAHLCLDIRLG